MELIIFFAFVAVLVGLLFYARQWTDRVHAPWQKIADDLGLTYGPEPDEFSGYIDGVPVGAYLDVRGTGKRRLVHTIVYADLSDILPSHLSVQREGFVQKMYPDTRIVDGRLQFHFSGKLINQPRLETSIRRLVECAVDLRRSALDDHGAAAEDHELSESVMFSSEEIDLENKWKAPVSEEKN